MNDLLQLDLTAPSHLSVESLLVNMLLGTLLAFVIRWLYLNYSHTLSNKESLSNIFPLLTLITILIILFSHLNTEKQMKLIKMMKNS